MQAIKNFMLDMLVMMMPVFSPSLIFAMIAIAVAGLMILFVDRDSTVKLAIRFVGWAVITSIILMFILDPVLALFKSNAEAFGMKSAGSQLFPELNNSIYNFFGIFDFLHRVFIPGKQGFFKFLLQFMPYLVLIITVFVLLFKSAPSALGIGRFLLVVGIIYIMCQIAGVFLGLSASVNFGDFMNWQNVIVEFWKLGVGMIIVGSILSISGRMARDRA